MRLQDTSRFSMLVGLAVASLALLQGGPRGPGEPPSGRTRAEGEVWRARDLRDKDRIDPEYDTFARRGLFTAEVADYYRAQGRRKVYTDLVVETDSKARFGVDLLIVDAPGRYHLVETRLSGQAEPPNAGKARGLDQVFQRGESLTIVSSPRMGLGEWDPSLEPGSRFRPSSVEVIDPVTLAAKMGGPEPAVRERPRAPETSNSEWIVRTSRKDIPQSQTPEALAMRRAVEEGVTLYRLGEFGKNTATEAQFWCFENPAGLSPSQTEAFRQKYGIPEANSIDFIVTGQLRPGARFVVRYAEPLQGRVGGGLEVVTEPGAVFVTGAAAKPQ